MLINNSICALLTLVGLFSITAPALGKDMYSQITTAAKCDDRSETPGKDINFKKAFELKESGRYQEALDLLQQKIRTAPNSCYIDYYYGWAVLCLAELGRLEEALDYYRIMRTRFSGDLPQGAVEIDRNWDEVLVRVQDIVAKSRQPNAKKILKQMREADKMPPSHRSRD